MSTKTTKPKSRVRFSLLSLLIFFTVSAIALGFFSSARSIARIEVVSATTGLPIMDFDYRLLIRDSVRSKTVPDPETTPRGNIRTDKGFIEVPFKTGSVAVNLFSNQHEPTDQICQFYFWKGPRTVKISMVPKRKVVLKAVDTMGNPIQNAYTSTSVVSSLGLDASLRDGAVAKSNEKGEFPPIYTNWSSVYVAHEQYRRREFQLEKGSADIDLKATIILEPGTRLSGRVVDQHGEPWSNLKFHAGDRLVQKTDEDGRFEILNGSRDPKKDKYWWVPDNVFLGTAVEIFSDRDNRIELTRTPLFQLKVTDESGVPVKLFSVATHYDGGTSWGQMGENGLFKLGWVQKVSTFAIKAEGHAIYWGDVNLTDDKMPVSVMLKSAAGVREGRIFNGSDPVAGAFVEWRPAVDVPSWIPEGWFPVSQTDSDGVFSLKNISHADGVLLVALNSKSPKFSVPAPVGSSENSSFGILAPFRNSGSIAGRIVDEHGIAVAFVDFKFSTLNSHKRGVEFRTDSDGRFSVSNVPTGQVSLRLSGNSHAYVRNTCVVFSGKTTDVDFVHKPAY